MFDKVRNIVILRGMKDKDRYIIVVGKDKKKAKKIEKFMNWYVKKVKAKEI